jgi:hypothetical protein
MDMARSYFSGGVGTMEVWLKAEKGVFSMLAGVCCTDVRDAVEKGSAVPVGDLPVREAADGTVCADEEDEGGRPLVSKGIVPGGIGWRPGDGCRAWDRWRSSI